MMLLSRKASSGAQLSDYKGKTTAGSTAIPKEM